jgi:hypothetical protein
MPIFGSHRSVRICRSPEDRRTVCPEKGEAHDYRLLFGDGCRVDAARRDPDPKPSAAYIADHIAFRRGMPVPRDVSMPSHASSAQPPDADRRDTTDPAHDPRPAGHAP